MDGVLNWVWQGSVVALMLALLLRLLDRAHANVRYGVSWAALLLVLSLPVVSWLVAAAPRGPGAPSAAVVSVPDAWWTSGAVMLFAWVAWVSLRTAGFARALVAVRRARLRSRPFPAHVESALRHWCALRHHGRRARLVLSESVTAAAVLGGGRPAIAVAPSLLATLDAGELDRVLIHEWVHVQRRDDFVQLLQAFVRIVAGWHPAVSWIDRRLHIEREIACDEMTVRITGSPKVYASCLLKLAGLRGAERAPVAAPAVLRATGLRARVTRIVSRHGFIAPRWSRGLAAGFVVLLCAVSFGAAGARIVEPATLALPFESVPRPGPERRSLAPLAVPAQTAQAESARAQRVSPAPSPTERRSGADAPPPVPADPPVSVEPAAAAEPVPHTSPDTLAERAAAPESSPAASPGSHPSEANVPAVTNDAQRWPWAAAADSGTALGRKSKDAGVATAGLFTRFARRVAGSF
jgi:beta-lactamase regulating signal transducer with metallopeptidase domain